MKVSWAAVSHPGLRRVANEDSYCAQADLGLFAVADGMGGHVAGEVASRAAVETIELFIKGTRNAEQDSTWPFPFEPGLSLEANRLKGAIRSANRRIAEMMAATDGLRGMATTVSAVLIAHSTAVIAHVGDSRVYLLREGQLERLTADHSWVEEQVRSGALDENAARAHPWRNIVTRALAGGEDPQVDVLEHPLHAADRLLLCSDGLYAVLTDDRIRELLAANRTLSDACDALLSGANGGGGPDNVTVLVLQLDAP